MPNTPELASPAELSDELRFVLHRLLRLLRRESPNHGLSPLHALLLVAIRETPGIGVGELARLEKLRSPTISGHIKTLEGMGLVARQAGADADRRRIGLVLTDQGVAMITTIKQSRADWLTARLAQLSPEERETIRTALAPLGKLIA
jgi:DNA-binding MarR family transcriptional regulator